VACRTRGQRPSPLSRRAARCGGDGGSGPSGDGSTGSSDGGDGGSGPSGDGSTGSSDGGDGGSGPSGDGSTGSSDGGDGGSGPSGDGSTGSSDGGDGGSGPSGDGSPQGSPPGQDSGTEGTGDGSPQGSPPGQDSGTEGTGDGSPQGSPPGQDSGTEGTGDGSPLDSEGSVIPPEDVTPVKKIKTKDFLNLDDLDLDDLKSLIKNSKFYKKLLEDEEDEDEDKKISKDKDEKEKSSKNGDYYETINYTEPYRGFNFAAVGDFGCNSNTESTIKNIQGKDIELVLALGDFSYTTDDKCWSNIINPLKEKTKIVIGNHDIVPPTLLSRYLTNFNLSKQYYSFDYENIHFLITSTEMPHKQGSEQYNFVVNDLKKASNNPNIDWIIVSQHKASYTSLSSVSPDSSMRDEFHRLYDQYGVDLVLQGHLHNYQRTYPLTYNPTTPLTPVVSDINKNTYFNPQGPVFLIAGTGGINTHSLKNQEPFVVYQQNSDFGFLNVNLNTNRTALEGKFYSNSGVVLDKFIISKEVGGKPEENKPPKAEDDVYSTFAKTKITLRTALDNDIDPNLNDELFISSIQSITKNQGLAVLNTNKKLITYYPNENFTGVDSFNYTVSDSNLLSDTGTITIEVKDRISSKDIIYNQTELDANNCNLGNIFEGVKDPQRFKIHSECEEAEGQVYQD